MTDKGDRILAIESLQAIDRGLHESVLGWRSDVNLKTKRRGDRKRRDIDAQDIAGRSVAGSYGKMWRTAWVTKQTVADICLKSSCRIRVVLTGIKVQIVRRVPVCEIDLETVLLKGIDKGHWEPLPGCSGYTCPPKPATR